MSGLTRFALTPALVLLMSGTAHAALTADQVWKSWQENAAVMGLSLTAATEAQNGGSLVLNGVTLIVKDDPDGSVKLSDLTFAANSDGSVTITPGADVVFTPPKGEETGSGSLTHAGLELVAREADGGIRYDYKAEDLNISYAFSVPGFSLEEGVEPEPDSYSGGISFVDLSGSYSDTPGENRTFGFDLAAASASYAFDTSSPGLNARSEQQSDTADVEISGQLILPKGMTLDQINSARSFGTALENGLALSVTSAFGETSGTSKDENDFLPFSMEMTGGPSSGDLALNKNVFAITSAATEGMRFLITSPISEAPAEISLAAMEVNLMTPVMAASEAADLAFKLAFTDLVVDEAIWAMADPAGNLDHGPLNLDFELSGKSKLDLIGLMETADSETGPVLPEPESLKLHSALIELAGAAFNAWGEVTFDNSMGMPLPLGQIDASLTGADQLINGLLAIGLISDNDAMSARAMMAAFMVPGAEADSLTSKIEFKEGGAIFANGQQIQ